MSEYYPTYHADTYRKIEEKHRAELAKLREENERLRTTLAEYANPGNWFTSADMSVEGSPDRCIYKSRGDGFTEAQAALTPSEGNNA